MSELIIQCIYEDKK